MRRPLGDLLAALDAEPLGQQIYDLIARLYPICRSITGNGFRQTMEILREYVPLEVHEVPTGTPVFDWTVPKEWNIRDAWVKDASGRKIIDFARSTLSVVSYSVPVYAKMPLSELKEHLYTIPAHPDWIPYKTSYYKEIWGLCLPHNELLALPDGEYEVCIDSELKDGHLTYGELYIPGESEDEMLLSTHCCHPSLCNDGLSGMSLYTLLGRKLLDAKLRYSYRILFVPGTIGSITWLARNEGRVSKIKHGMSAACIGDGGHPTYKKSRRGDAVIDRAVAHVLSHRPGEHEIREFSPYGYDERQFCSPGFNLPFGALSKTAHGCFPEYHTSADDLTLVQPEYLQDSLEMVLSVLFVLENDRTYRNLNPKCEPQLGQRGLYSLFGGLKDTKTTEMAILWVLNLSDGSYSLLDIAERSGMAFRDIHTAAMLLQQAELLEAIG